MILPFFTMVGKKVRVVSLDKGLIKNSELGSSPLFKKKKIIN